MKYLYKGMAMPGWGDISGSVLLGWHEKVRPKGFLATRSWINPLVFADDSSRRLRGRDALCGR